MQKICTKCLQTQDLSAFHRDKQASDGLSSHCKTCRKAFSKAWYHSANRAEIRKKQAVYYQHNQQKICEKTRQWHKANQVRSSLVKSEWGKAHPEKRRLATNKWRAANRERMWAAYARSRARKKNAPVNDFSVAQWQEMQAAYNFCCAYCGKKVEPLTMDHLTPLSKGGSHTASNIVPACKSCNSRKRIGNVLSPVQPLLLTIARTKRHKKR